nr:FeoB-associated Cys-rich membrane protein [uncultured Porphyromonas sp.]
MTIQLILVYIIVALAVAATLRFLWRIFAARPKEGDEKGSSSCPGCSGCCHTPTPPKRAKKAKDKEA